jgi:hypothetical protein
MYFMCCWLVQLLALLLALTFEIHSFIHPPCLGVFALIKNVSAAMMSFSCFVEPNQYPNEDRNMIRMVNQSVHHVQQVDINLILV